MPTSTPDTIDAALDGLPEEGKSIEELAMIEDPQGQVYLDFGDTLNTTLKGAKPNSSELKIQAISMPIKGQIEDSEQVVTVLLTARVSKQEMVYRRQPDGMNVSTTRRTVVTPVNVLPVSVEQASAILGI